MPEPPDIKDDGEKAVRELIERTLRAGLPPRRRRTSTVFVGALTAGCSISFTASLLIFRPAGQPLTPRLGLALLFAAFALVGIDILRKGLAGKPADDSFFIKLLRRLNPTWVACAPLAFAGFAALRGLENHEGATLESAALLVFGWLSFYAQILFHELGHLRVARALGYPIFRVVGGPFAFEPKAGRLRLVQNREWRYLMMGAVSFEVGPEGIPRGHELRIAAAGPVYTLLTLVAWTLFGRAVSSAGLAGAVAEANQVMGIYMLAINLVPYRLGTLASDGYRIREALRPGGHHH